MTTEEPSKEKAGKFFSKSRWRKEAKEEAVVPKKDIDNFNDDVVDFLKPSMQKAAALAPKPKIDVAAAQRWPAATDIKLTPSPGFNGISSLRGRGPGKRGMALTVKFMRTNPEIIGEGGDICEEPSIEVSRRKARGQGAIPMTHSDDINVGTASNPALNGWVQNQQARFQSDSSQDSIPKRSATSAAELSPPLRERFEARSAPSTKHPNGPAPGEGMGHRPSPIKRAPTGVVHAQSDIAPVRPSFDSEDFVPKPLKRSQTGWSDTMADMPEDESEEIDSPQEVNVGAEGLARQYTHESGHLLEAAPSNPQSFSAQIQHRMRAEEGRALHEAKLRRLVDESQRPSSSDSASIGGGSNGSPYGSPTRAAFPQQGRPSLDKAPTSMGRSSYEHRPHPQQRPSALQYSSYLEPDRESSPSGNYKPGGSPYQQPLPSLRMFTPERSPDPNAQWKGSPQPPQPPQFQGSPNPNNFNPPPSPGFQQNLPVRQAESDGKNLAPPSTVPSGRSRAESNAAREAAFDDFGERVTHMRGIFRLTAEIKHPAPHYSPFQWLRAASWWFLRARSGLEIMIRARSRDQSPDFRSSPKLTQAHVDLAKAWWIVSEVIPSHPGVKRYGEAAIGFQYSLARDAGDMATAEIYEAYDSVMGNIKALLSSMKKHGVMPPEQALIQGQDQNIWIEYPNFASDVAAVLSGDMSKSLVVDRPKQAPNPAYVLPLGDTRRDFCYGRMFVQVSMTTDDAESDRVSLPCVLNILRSREDWGVKIAICSQNELVTLLVGNDHRYGPTWDDVQWKSRARGMYIQLNRGYTLNVELQEADYRQLWNIYDYTRKIEASLAPHEDERIVHDITVAEFKYTEPANPQAFPAERIKRCRIRIFEDFDEILEGTGQRRFHRSYRLLVVTSPKIKTLSSVTHTFDCENPIIFELRDDGNVPAMILRVSEPQKQATMLMVFNDGKDRSILFACLNGMKIGSNETVFAQVPLKSVVITKPDEATLGPESGEGGVMNRLHWQDVKVLNSDPEKGSSEVPRTVLSEHLRIIARHSAGSITDWMNLGEYFLATHFLDQTF